MWKEFWLSSAEPRGRELPVGGGGDVSKGFQCFFTCLQQRGWIRRSCLTNYGLKVGRWGKSGEGAQVCSKLSPPESSTSPGGRLVCSVQLWLRLPCACFKCTLNKCVEQDLIFLLCVCSARKIKGIAVNPWHGLEMGGRHVGTCYRPVLETEF